MTDNEIEKQNRIKKQMDKKRQKAWDEISNKPKGSTLFVHGWYARDKATAGGL